MASVKADKPVGSQVHGLVVKQALAGTGGDAALKAPTSKSTAKKVEQKPKAIKGGKPARQKRSNSNDDESTKGECINKQQPVAKDAAIEEVKPARKQQKRSTDEESITPESCVYKESPATTGTQAIKGGKPVRKPRRRFVDDDI